jgi:spoIIIJ-associated protein
MKKIEALTLEEAYAKASSEFNCSITDLDIEVVQNPTNGFLGFGKKSAIIVANLKVSQTEVYGASSQQINRQPNRAETQHSHKREKRHNQQHNNQVEPTKQQTIPQPSKDKQEIIKDKRQEVEPQKPAHTKEIFDNFYSEKKSTDEIALEIESELVRLFALTCFKIDKIVVTKEDRNTILIEFDGDDAALLIGKEGYRYKALSYMLFNWINPKYNLMVKLEIAEFLKNQEEMIRNYLAPLIETIKIVGYGQTKPLDGVLSHIALKQLRDSFPNKYVVTRDSDDGVKYVIVADFKK